MSDLLRIDESCHRDDGALDETCECCALWRAHNGMMRAEVERLRALLNPDDEALIERIWDYTSPAVFRTSVRSMLTALRDAALGGERDE